VGAAVVGCAGAPARISDGWAVAAGPSGAAFVNHERPVEGKPLAVSPKAVACLKETELLALLGPRCDHESENVAPSPPVGDLGPGIPTQTPQVRWYCNGKLVVRVVFDACDSSRTGNLDGVHPLEIAVATHP